MNVSICDLASIDWPSVNISMTIDAKYTEQARGQLQQLSKVFGFIGREQVNKKSATNYIEGVRDRC